MRKKPKAPPLTNLNHWSLIWKVVRQVDGHADQLAPRRSHRNLEQSVLLDLAGKESLKTHTTAIDLDVPFVPCQRSSSEEQRLASFD